MMLLAGPEAGHPRNGQTVAVPSSIDESLDQQWLVNIAHAHLAFEKINDFFVAILLAAINVVVVPSQILGRWLPITVLRQSHILTVECVILFSVVELFLDA